jgi:mitochondrial fission protein ELM1
VAPSTIYGRGPLFVLGDGFTSVSEVYISGIIAEVKSVDKKQIKILLPDIDEGLYDIIVINRHNKIVEMSNHFEIKIQK